MFSESLLALNHELILSSSVFAISVRHVGSLCEIKILVSSANKKIFERLDDTL